ncbi:hypothetical protein C4J87_3024 [Pseudomonas sp. R1-43-08]|uniref:hypothetical protein n=1 Tax=Pseudomonas sp. R1-43-08 TaxID=1173270 RepID=UPI000F58356C|nr:hypothetical protein [Pseudomonas sp. R1-43-08]AZF43180.1 hypothetical protein C4J87_3024 [Pseudomonas sp. R1-43-08]
MLLTEERTTAFELLPQLAAFLESASLLELEQGPSQRLADLFRTVGRPGLAIAEALGGGVSVHANLRSCTRGSAHIALHWQ